MKQKQNHLLNICLALIVTSITILLSDTTFFKRLELLSLDTFFQLRFNSPPPAKDIIIIEITREDIEEIGRWPWERTWFVKMTKALQAFEAREILYDFIMSEASKEENDIQLQKAIQEAGNVYLPTFWDYSKEGVRKIIKPIDKLMKYAKGTGFVNITSDIDGSFRRIPLYSQEDDGVEYNIVLQLAMDHSDMKIKAILPNEMVLSNASREVHIPLIDSNHMLINWYGKWKRVFKRYSFLDIIRAHDDILAGRKPTIDIKPIKNSSSMVAHTATGFYDSKSIPLQPQYPGIGIVATSISNILNSYFIRIVPFWVNALFIYMVSLIPPLLIYKEKPIKEILLIFSGVVVFFIIFYLFLMGYKMNLSVPLLALFNSYVVVTAYNYITPKAMFKKIEVHEKKNLELKKEYKNLSKNLEITEKQKKDLEKINQELDRFVHTVSHDLRSPLMGILGYADLLQKKIKNTLNTREKGFLNEIFISVDRLNVMIDDILQTTKISHIESPYEKVNINELIAMIDQRLKFRIKESKAELIVQQNLPEIICDRIKIGEVFHNLITNAIKFASGDKNPKVEIGYQDRDNTHEFYVKDNGIGIDPKDQTEIFEMFRRIDKSGQYQGTGVGLNIVKNIIDDHSGQVWVESKQGKGATFLFTIPKDLKSV